MKYIEAKNKLKYKIDLSLPIPILMKQMLNNDSKKNIIIEDKLLKNPKLLKKVLSFVLMVNEKTKTVLGYKKFNLFLVTRINVEEVMCNMETDLYEKFIEINNMGNEIFWIEESANWGDRRRMWYGYYSKKVAGGRKWNVFQNLIEPEFNYLETDS